MPSPAPSNVDLNANRGPTIVRSVIAVSVVSTAFVILRFIARRSRHVKFGADDYLIVFACVLNWGICAFSIVSVHYGTGKHVAAVPLSNVSKLLKALFADQIIYATCITTIKFSILLMYRRIFPIKKFSIATYVVGAVVAAWYIAVVLVSIFTCIPVQDFWESEQIASCHVNSLKAYLGNAIPNIITDVTILCLPMPMVWNLHLSKFLKLEISAAFLAGGFVCITSIIRFIYLLRDTAEDNTWTSSNTIIWSCVEPAAGVISACLPCLRGLFTRKVFRDLYAGATPWNHNKSDLAASAPSLEARLDPRQEGNRNFNRLGGDSVIELAPASNAVLQTTCEGDDALSIIESGGMPGNVIGVKTDLKMVSS